VRAVVVAISMLAWAGCGDPTKGSVDGKELFGMVCANCHGPRGKPTPQMAARYGSRDLTDPKFRAKMTQMLVENQIHNGSKNKIMPAYDGLISDAQIKAVAAYVSSPEFLNPPE
jgi:mono/diheme cytochrome c family protein